MEKIKVYTGGTFDLFHVGHVRFLKQCALIGSVTVAVNTDEFVQEYKNNKPIMSVLERCEIVESCKWVDKVVIHDGFDSKPTIMREKPNVLAVGTDWIKKNIYEQMQIDTDWLNQNNIALVYLQYTEGISSTYIKQRICK